MNELALSIGGTPILAPSQVPVGGLATTGKNLIQLGLNLFFLVGMVMVLVFVLYSGIQWAASGGDKTKIQNARNRLTYTIIGLLVFVGAFVILDLVIKLLGFNTSFFLNLQIP